MRKLGFEKNERLFSKIIQAFENFKFSFIELKLKHKKLKAVDLGGSDFNCQKQILNAWLHFESKKNLALMEMQRQRAK